jgi:hypothetical protein
VQAARRIALAAVQVIPPMEGDGFALNLDLNVIATTVLLLLLLVLHMSMHPFARTAHNVFETASLTVLLGSYAVGVGLRDTSAAGGTTANIVWGAVLAVNAVLLGAGGVQFAREKVANRRRPRQNSSDSSRYQKHDGSSSAARPLAVPLLSLGN